MAGLILVIEDNAANLELMMYLLQAFGHTALAAETGEKGLELAQRETPDVIVCDVQLPGIDGYEVARQLKTNPRLQAIPRIAVTAMAMVGDRDKLLAGGFDGYIGKPVRPETLVQEIEAFLPAGRTSAGRSGAASYTSPAAPGVTLRSGCTGAILVVDNTPANLDLTKTILESAGYGVITAASVAEATAVIRKARPDLILSDVHMPGRNGYDFLNDLHGDDELKSIPFVLISSTSSEGELLRYRDVRNKVKFLIRPIDPEKLLQEVQSSLEKQT